jgi:hypothetical protein
MNFKPILQLLLSFNLRAGSESRLSSIGPLLADAKQLVVFGRYHRFIFPSRHWLVHAISYEKGFSSKCIINGRLEENTKNKGDYSF